MRRVVLVLVLVSLNCCWASSYMRTLQLLVDITVWLQKQRQEPGTKRRQAFLSVDQHKNVPL